MEEVLEASVVASLGYHNEYKLVQQTTKKMVFAHVVYHEIDLEHFDYNQFVTEDETPVDNLFSEKQQRLLVDPLHNNDWTARKFLAATNVGIYYNPKKPPIVPDMFISMDVNMSNEWDDKKNRSYFVWLHKVPEVVIEIVSNKIGGEDRNKFDIYAEIGIPYYVIHDPYLELFGEKLNVFHLKDTKYEKLEDWEFFMPILPLGLTLWEGLFEGEKATWLRWCNKERIVLSTGEENTRLLTAEIEQTQAKVQVVETKLQEAESKVQVVETKLQEAESKVQVVETKLQEAEAEKLAALKEIEELKAKLATLGL